MNAYSDYSVEVIINKCEYNIRVIKEKLLLADSVKCGDNDDIISIGAYRLKLNSKLTTLYSLQKMCNTTKQNYITIDLEFVELLWPNN